MKRGSCFDPPAVKETLTIPEADSTAGVWSTALARNPEPALEQEGVSWFLAVPRSRRPQEWL
jgi:hypothetical protein